MSTDLNKLLEQSKTPIKNNIYLIPNTFTEDIHNRIYNEFINSDNWGFLQTSNTNSNEETKFWINILGGYTKKGPSLKYSTFYERILFDMILKHIHPILQTRYNYEIDIIPFEIYVNGQSRGQSGNWHQDATNTDSWTFLYYLNKEWKVPHWDGFTSFADAVDNIYINQYKPNSSVLFNATIWHYGCAPSIYCNNLRMTLAYKLLVVPKGKIDYDGFLKQKKELYLNDMKIKLENV